MLKMFFTKSFENTNERYIALIFLFLSYFISQMALSKNTEQKDSNKNPEKIVSLTVGSDEILLELLNTDYERQRISALSSLADNPVYSESIEMAKKVRGRVGAQIESVINLKPDLVICAQYTNPDTLAKLKELKVPHLRLKKFSSIEDIQNNIKTIGLYINKSSESIKLADKLNTINKVKALEKKTFINYHPSGFIMGNSTIISDLLTKMGMVNVIKEKGWPRISSEKLLQLDPDYIIASGSKKDSNKVLAKLKTTTGWKHFKAIKQDKVVFVEPSLLSSTSHHILRTYEALRQRLLKKSNNGMKLEKKL